MKNACRTAALAFLLVPPAVLAVSLAVDPPPKPAPKPALGFPFS